VGSPAIWSDCALPVIWQGNLGGFASDADKTKSASFMRASPQAFLSLHLVIALVQMTNFWRSSWATRS